MSDPESQPDTEPTTTETTAEPTTEPAVEPTTEGALTDKAEPKETEAKAEPLTAEAITLPEGVEVDEESMSAFLEVANNHGLSPEAANELVGLQAKLQEQAAEQLSQFWEQKQDEWKNETRAALGDKFDQSLGNIRQLVDEYGDPEVYTVLNETGAGNNPHIIQMLAKVADQLVKEAEPVSGAPSSTPQDRAHRMFPNMN